MRYRAPNGINMRNIVYTFILALLVTQFSVQAKRAQAVTAGPAHDPAAAYPSVCLLARKSLGSSGPVRMVKIHALAAGGQLCQVSDK